MQLVAFKTAGQHATAHGLPAEGRAHRPLSGRPERRAVPDRRRLAAGADGQPLGGGGGRVLRRPPGRRLQTVWVNLLCATYTGGRRRRQHLRRHRAVHDAGRPRDAERALLRARRPHARSSPRSTGSIVLLDPAETGSCLSVLERQRRRQGARLRPLPRHALPRLRQHHLDERQRLPELAEPGRRRRGAGGRARHPGHRRPPHPHRRARLPGQRLARRPDLGAADPAERVVHLLPDLRAGAGRLQPPERAADLPGRGELRVRAQRRRRGHAGDPAPPGVLEPAQRRRRPALRQSLHVAVHRRLAEPSRHAGLGADGAT